MVLTKSQTFLQALAVGILCKSELISTTITKVMKIDNGYSTSVPTELPNSDLAKGCLDERGAI